MYAFFVSARFLYSVRWFLKDGVVKSIMRTATPCEFQSGCQLTAKVLRRSCYGWGSGNSCPERARTLTVKRLYRKCLERGGCSSCIIKTNPPSPPAKKKKEKESDMKISLPFPLNLLSPKSFPPQGVRRELHNF